MERPGVQQSNYGALSHMAFITSCLQISNNCTQSENLSVLVLKLIDIYVEEVSWQINTIIFVAPRSLAALNACSKVSRISLSVSMRPTTCMFICCALNVNFLGTYATTGWPATDKIRAHSERSDVIRSSYLSYLIANVPSTTWPAGT